MRLSHSTMRLSHSTSVCPTVYYSHLHSSIDYSHCVLSTDYSPTNLLLATTTIPAPFSFHAAVIPTPLSPPVDQFMLPPRWTGHRLCAHVPVSLMRRSATAINDTISTACTTLPRCAGSALPEVLDKPSRHSRHMRSDDIRFDRPAERDCAGDKGWPANVHTLT